MKVTTWEDRRIDLKQRAYKRAAEKDSWKKEVESWNKYSASRKKKG